MDGICVSSLLFLRTNNALSRGCSKHKFTEAFCFCLWQAYQTSDSFIYFFFSPPSWTSIVSVTVIFTVQWHSFSLSLLYHEADVTDQSARQLCLMSKAPRYKGKCRVWQVSWRACFILAAASCHTSCCSTSLDSSVMGIGIERLHIPGN